MRPWATCQVIGDALSFAIALGYVYVAQISTPPFTHLSSRRSQIYKRGYAFRRGILIILMFQQEQVPSSRLDPVLFLIPFQVDPKTQLPIPAHADTLWEVEVKTADPIRNSQETPLTHAIDAVLEVQILMKGLLDLRRQDV